VIVIEFIHWGAEGKGSGNTLTVTRLTKKKNRFMCADAYWTLAMACNVYLTFFYKYDAAKLRNLEKYYMLACYGVPFVPSLVYLFVTSSQGNRMYGDATLWCWIHKDFDVMRIITFYGPVW
jgi:hypothetical protein